MHVKVLVDIANVEAHSVQAEGKMVSTCLVAVSISQQFQDLNLLSQKLRKTNTGVAMGFAMAGVPTLLSTEKVALSVNWGTFQGENGGALSGAVRIYHNVQLQGSFAYGFRENMAGGHAGLRFGF